MQKDYEISQQFAPEIMDSLNIQYAYRDACVDFQVEFLSCQRQEPQIIENKFIYKIPFLNRLSKCKNYLNKWKACQIYREKEIFEEMRKVYVQNIKQQQPYIPNKFTQESAAKPEMIKK